MKALLDKLSARRLVVLSTLVLTLATVCTGGLLAYKVAEGDETVSELRDRTQEAKERLINLFQAKLAWFQQIQMVPFMVERVRSETMLFINDVSEDTTALADEIESLQGHIKDIGESFPADLDRTDLDALDSSLSILSDIEQELRETTSPTQVHEMAEDTEAQVDEVIKLTMNLGQASARYFREASAKVIEGDNSLLTDLERVFLNVKKVSLWGMGILVLTIVGFQFGVFLPRLSLLLERVLKNVGMTSSQLKDSSQILLSKSGEAEQSTKKEKAELESALHSVAAMKLSTQSGQECSDQLLKESDELGTRLKQSDHETSKIDAATVKVVDSISELDSIDEIMTNIGDRVQQIGSVVFKTQLLAFNASIESARAGAHGKGFAVVAAEVSNLARAVSDLAGEINELVSGAQARTGALLAQVKESTEVLSDTKTNFVTVFTEMKETIEKVEELVTDINSASSSQRQKLSLLENNFESLGAASGETFSAVESSKVNAEQVLQHSADLVVTHSDISKALWGTSDHSARTTSEKIAWRKWRLWGRQKENLASEEKSA